MNTSKRAEASRANGARSHGPKTEEGKRRSSMNSTRHGLLARCVLLVNETPVYFEQLCREFIEKFQPADNIELACVEEMAAATWRLRRIMAIETNLMNQELDKNRGDDPFLCVAQTFSMLSAGTALQLIDRYENRLHRLYHRSFNNLLRLRELSKQQQSLPDEDPQPLPPDPPESENENQPNEPEAAQPPVDATDSGAIHHPAPLPSSHLGEEDDIPSPHAAARDGSGGNHEIN